MFVIEDESFGDLWGIGSSPLDAVQNLLTIKASRQRYLTTKEVERLIVLGEIVLARYNTALIMKEVKT